MKRGIFALAFVVALGGAAAAQNYPAKPIKLVVPFAPGGPADVIGRIIGQQAGIILRQILLDAPDARDEWFIYQTLAGAFPLPLERAWPVIEKSLRESKRRTSWVRVDEGYEQATRSFLE